MSTAASQAEAIPERLDFYRIRDDIARHYNPATAFEVMLVTQIAQAWLCLQFAYEAQRRYFQANDVLEAIAKQFDQYKAITREVTNCERVWRHAMLQLEKTQRQRQHNGPQPDRRPRPEPIAEPLVSRSPAANPVNPTHKPLTAVASAGGNSADEAPPAATQAERPMHATVTGPHREPLPGGHVEVGSEQHRPPGPSAGFRIKE